MIVDTFLYAGERDLLDLRMCELSEVADHFVAVEGTLTFTGTPRKLVPLRLPNLTHIVVDDFPAASARNPWKREVWQRNAILRGLNGLRDDDLILMGDVDELPHADVIPGYVEPGSFIRFGLALYQFNLNNRVTNDPAIERAWSNTTLCRLDDLRAWYPQGVRNRHKGIVIYGGWHLSWLINPREKHTAYSHQELRNFGDTIEEQVKNRWGYQYEFVSGVGHLPRCIQENLDRYGKYLQYAPATHFAMEYA